MDLWDIGTSLEFNIIVTGTLGVRSKDKIIWQMEAPVSKCDLLSVMVSWV